MRSNKKADRSSSKVEKIREIHERTDEDSVIYLSPENYSKISTPKRREIIEKLRQNSYESKSELVEDLGRDKKNVHEDLDLLRRTGVVNMEKNGRKIKPELKYSSIRAEEI